MTGNCPKRCGLFLSVVCAFAVSACGASSKDSEATSVPNIIRSSDFAVLPCAHEALPSPCAIVMAGGKRVILGAPAGIAAGLRAEELRNIDAVLLLSLRGEGVEGVDELRNGSWRAGREGPLPVGGPSGTGDFIGALNRAFEISDALVFVEENPAGGFDAALLAVLPGEGETKGVVFDTGDLRITKIETATSRAGYWVDYGGARVVLEPCGVTQASKFAEQFDLLLSCDEGWQLTEPKFLVRAVEP